MEQTTSKPYTTNEAASGAPTPFPVGGQAASATASGAAAEARSHDPAAAPVAHDLLDRVTQRAHDAVDGVSTASPRRWTACRAASRAWATRATNGWNRRARRSASTRSPLWAAR